MQLLFVALLVIHVAVANVLGRTDDWSSWHSWNAYPVAVDSVKGVKYEGIYQSEVEAFLGIRYGQDTGGQNRFKPPQPYVYASGSHVVAQSDGPACPQPLGDQPFPVYLSNITEVSEDCLLLNVKRPNGTTSKSKLPVMAFIHGDSFIGSSKDELVSQPGGLIIQSVENGYPVMHVSMNYRLGAFGFAQSTALQQEGSENAGLRDQRLALDWIHDNIATFGGDPDKVTIFGQSSGGLAVGMQIMAFGATKPVPFQKAICESQALEGGITLNFTREAMDRLVGATGCNTTALDSAATVSCLRALPMQQLLDAQTATYSTDPSANIGDEWLPVVDGDFLPEAPSDLIYQGKFANITTVIGWDDGDVNIYLPRTVQTAQGCDDFLVAYLPGFTRSSLDMLQSMYPVSEFTTNAAANLTDEFYRCARIFRDILMVCMPIFYGDALHRQGNEVYYYDQNQTFLGPALDSIGLPGLGVVHTSEFAYVFGNLSHYNVDNFPFLPNASDYALAQRESRSWSSFANFGTPSLPGKNTLQGWGPAYTSNNADDGGMGGALTDIFVIGGGQEGLSATDSGGSNQVLTHQQLPGRCAFLNSPEIIKQLGY